MRRVAGLVLSVSFLAPPPAFSAPPLPEAPIGRDPHPSDAAVVIGVEDYFMLPDAPGASADAQAVRDTLVSTRGVPEDRVALLTEGASRERILGAARAAGQLASADGTVWLYFAGHGMHTDGTLQLLGVDAQADPAALLARAITVDELARELGRGGGRPMLWLDVGFGPNGRSDRPLGHEEPSESPPLAAAPSGSILWTTSPGAGPQTIDGHGAFTYLSVGALRGWADGDPKDGTVTPEEAQRWAAETATKLDMTPPLLLGDTTTLAWATGVTADPPRLWADDVGAPEATGGPETNRSPDVAQAADAILSDARLSLRRMAVRLGGDAPLDTDEVRVGRVRGRSEDEGLAPALAGHLDKTLPSNITAVRFTAFTSKPPLSVRVVTVNVDIERDGELQAFLVEGITLPTRANWPMTAEQIGRKLKDQLAGEPPR